MAHRKEAISFATIVKVGPNRDFSDPDVMDAFMQKVKMYDNAYPVIRKGNESKNAKDSRCVAELHIQTGDEVVISATGSQKLQAVRVLAAWLRNKK